MGIDTFALYKQNQKVVVIPQLAEITIDILLPAQVTGWTIHLLFQNWPTNFMEWKLYVAIV